MKQLCLAVSLLFLVAAGHAQNAANGTISASGSTCATTQACIYLALVNNQTTGSGAAAITVSANASGNTLQFEGSADGVTWAAINAFPLNSTTAVTSTISTGTWQINVAGLVGVRVRCSAFVSGTSTVAIQSSVASARSGTSGSSGILSINSDTTQAQTITGSGGASVSTSSGTTTIQAGPGLVNGGVILYPSGSSPVPYDAASNTNTARGTALIAAMTALATGGTIVTSCLDGTGGSPYNTGTTLLPSLSGLSDISLASVCGNYQQAMIETTSTSASGAPFFNLSGVTNLYVNGLGFKAVGTATAIVPVGTIAPNTTAFSATFVNTYCDGLTDCYDFHNSTSAPITFRCINCQGLSADDDVAIFDSYTNGLSPCSGSTYDFIDPVLVTNNGNNTGGAAFNLAGTSGGSSCAIINVINPRWVVTAGAGDSTNVFGLRVRDGLTANVCGITRDSSVTTAGSGTPYDLLDYSSAAYGNLHVCAASYYSLSKVGGFGNNPDSSSNFYDTGQILASIFNAVGGGTGIVRSSGVSAVSASELSGDCTTSGSNAVTCTKVNGNPVPQLVYSTPVSVTMVTSGTNTVLTGPTNLVTSPVGGTYSVNFQIIATTVGSGGTCTAGTMGISIGWKDVSTGDSIALSTTTYNIAFSNMSSAPTSAATTITYTTGTVGTAATIWAGYPREISVASGTALTYQVVQGTNSNCTTPPVLEVRPRVYYMGY